MRRPCGRRAQRLTLARALCCPLFPLARAAAGPSRQEAVAEYDDALSTFFRNTDSRDRALDVGTPIDSLKARAVMVRTSAEKQRSNPCRARRL